MESIPDVRCDTKNDRLLFLDGIRGWGALTVLVYHVFVNAFPLNERSGNILHQIFFFNGTLAVWLFFVASGFSLSIGFSRKKDRKVLLKLAYGRYFRLAIPILFFSILMYLALKFEFIPSVQDRPEMFRAFLNGEPNLLQTVRFALFDVFFNYSEKVTMIPPLWTMPIEMMGSAIVLLTCAIVGGGRYRIPLYLLIFLLLAYKGGNCTYYSAFVLGVILSEVYELRDSKVINVFSAIVFVLAISMASALPVKAWLYPWVSGLMFIGMIYCQPIRVFLESGVSRFLGRISFSLYMLHAIVMWVFLMPLFIGLNKQAAHGHVELFLFNVATIVISIILSRVLVFVDEFGVEMSRKISGFLLRVSYRE